jgi:hypothetical protein
VHVPGLARLLFVLLLHAAFATAEPTAAFDSRLNVSILVFDPGVPEDRASLRDLDIFPRIRKIEALLMPFKLRESLVDAGDWGAVRVEPASDLASEVLVEGSILHSDGELLSIDIRAADSTGRVWVDDVFSGDDSIYTDIAGALRNAKNRLDDREFDIIRNVAMLRYARSLAPTAFAGYLGQAEDGTITLERLPARDDPMLGWIHRIRETVYVFTDTIDAKYRSLNGDIDSVYEVWREYRAKSRMFEAQNIEHARATASAAPRGSYRALRNQYDNYRYDRITAQELDRLAVAFDNEVGPTISNMETRIAELEGWVDDKYTEWRRLLEALFEARTTAEPVSPELIEEIRRLTE